MTLEQLYLNCNDDTRLCISDGERRYSGNWYEDHMMDVLARYKYHKVDITIMDDDAIVARVRRY